MSATELIESAGICNATLSKITTGKQRPTPKTIGKIAKALNVSVEYLTEEQ
jgi:transcriptional regulator with XRE-family HTH domain